MKREKKNNKTVNQEKAKKRRKRAKKDRKTNSQYKLNVYHKEEHEANCGVGQEA